MYLHTYIYTYVDVNVYIYIYVYLCLLYLYISRYLDIHIGIHIHIHIDILDCLPSGIVKWLSPPPPPSLPLPPSKVFNNIASCPTLVVDIQNHYIREGRGGGRRSAYVIMFMHSTYVYLYVCIYMYCIHIDIDIEITHFSSGSYSKVFSWISCPLMPNRSYMNDKTLRPLPPSPLSKLNGYCIMDTLEYCQTRTIGGARVTLTLVCW